MEGGRSAKATEVVESGPQKITIGFWAPYTIIITRNPKIVFVII